MTQDKTEHMFCEPHAATTWEPLTLALHSWMEVLLLLCSGTDCSGACEANYARVERCKA